MLVEIVVVCISAGTALYTANRQARVSREVEAMRNQNGAELARLTASLDTRTIAYRELFNAASFYYYALRSASQRSWDEHRLQQAETNMISATQHLLLQSVDGSLRPPLLQIGACPFPSTPLLSILMLVTHTCREILPALPGFRVMAMSM